MPSARDKDDEILDIRRKELMSAIPWLNRWLITLDVAPRLRVSVEASGPEMDCRWSPSHGGCLRIIRVAMQCTGGRGRTPLALRLGAALASLPLFYVRWKRAKRFARFEQHLPEALDVVVGALRAGHSLTSAIGIVAREGAPNRSNANSGSVSTSRISGWSFAQRCSTLWTACRFRTCGL